MAKAFHPDGLPLEGKARYEFLDHLGEGQFGSVFKAKDLVTNDIVAIKKVCFYIFYLI
jgi:serine/threonine protein kinase